MSNKALKLCSIGALIRSQLRILCSIVSLYLCSGTLGWTLQEIQGLLLSNPYLPFSFSFIFYITLCNIFNSNSAITLLKARPVHPHKFLGFYPGKHHAYFSFIYKRAPQQMLRTLRSREGLLCNPVMKMSFFSAFQF